MVDASLEAQLAKAPARETYAEQILFDRSPFNLWITTALIYAGFMALYGLASWIEDAPWFMVDASGFSLHQDARVALTLPLIFCTSLALQRYSRLRELADVPNFELATKPGVDWAPTFRLARLRWATLVGLALGVSIIVLIAPWRRMGGFHPAQTAWFMFASAAVTALFLRGLVLTAAGAGQTRRMLKDGLVIDLLRIERLYPWGRAAARTSLVWFAVSAAALLLVVDEGLTVYTIPLLAGCAGMGVWVFVGTLTMVHHRIREAKAEELERLRDEIDTARAALDHDPTAPARLQSLLAYEKRIDEAPEWPFDQTILVRVGASALILAVPWFGQAVAGVVVENVSKVVR